MAAGMPSRNDERLTQGTTVVVLGAGFSIGAGQPLTRSILPTCRDFVNPRLLPELDRYLQEKAIFQEKAIIDRPLVEFEEDIEDLLLRLQHFKSAVALPIYSQNLGTPTHVYEEPCPGHYHWCLSDAPERGARL